MIVTSWEEAREAIVEQRGERLAADIEALLRERELLAEEKTMTSAEIEAEVRRRLQEQEGRIKEVEAECMAHHNRTAMVALGTEHFDHGPDEPPCVRCRLEAAEDRVVTAVNQAEAWEKAAAEEEARAQKAKARIKELEAEIETLRERWACVDCGRTPDGGRSGDLYVSICHSCHRCNCCARLECTICGGLADAVRQRDDLHERAFQAEARLEAVEALARQIQREGCQCDGFTATYEDYAEKFMRAAEGKP